MKTKGMKPDYGSIEDRRNEQKSNRGAKGPKLRVGGYKEDPEAVAARMEVSNHMDNVLKGKSDKQMDTMTQMRQEIGKRMAQRTKK